MEQNCNEAIIKSLKMVPRFYACEPIVMIIESDDLLIRAYQRSLRELENLKLVCVSQEHWRGIPTAFHP